MSIKRGFCIALAALTAFSLCACGKKNVDEPDVTAAPEALVTETDLSASPNTTEALVKSSETLPSRPDYDLVIPVVSDEEFFKFGIACRDYCCYDNDIDWQPNAMSYIMGKNFYNKSDAVRTMLSGDMYAIYESESGYRRYVIFNHLENNKNRVLCARGFEIVIKELHSYEEFSQLKAGDPIDMVVRIDPLTEFIKNKIEGGSNPEYPHQCIEEGWPITSFHYLSDGVIAIEYDMTEDRVLYIVNIVYAEDYRLTSSNGITINYKLFDIDLPRQ